MTNIVHLIDNMEFMAGLPDNAFDLAIVDPMYIMPKEYYLPGNEKSGKAGVIRKHRDQAKKLSLIKPVRYEFLKELCKVSKNQIIWGINTFSFAGYTPGRIVWDKKNDASSFSDCEIASCSLHVGVRIFRYRWSGFLQENMKNKEARIHAFQKPIALYKWLLANYAKPGQTIFDSHVGSGSIRIACHDMGFDFVGCENDPEYWQAQEDRYKTHLAKGPELFSTKEYQERIFEA